MSAAWLSVDAGFRPAAPAFGALRELAGSLETFTVWCFTLHLVYAALLLLGSADAAHHLLFPFVHFNAWAVLAGSHALVYVAPETMHAPRLRRQQHLHGRCFAILIGHELLHVAPLVVLYVVPSARPAPATLSLLEFAAGTGMGVALGCSYLAWQSHRQNVYRVTPNQLKSMAAVAILAGMLANGLACLKLA